MFWSKYSPLFKKVRKGWEAWRDLESAAVLLLAPASLPWTEQKSQSFVVEILVGGRSGFIIPSRNLFQNYIKTWGEETISALQSREKRQWAKALSQSSETGLCRWEKGLCVSQMELSSSKNLFASFSESCQLLKSLKSHPKVPKLHFNFSNSSDYFSHTLKLHDEQSHGLTSPGFL